MNPIAILKEVEDDLAAFGSIPGSIRDKVKQGVTVLRKIESDVTTLVDTVTGKAQSALDSLKAAAAQAETLTTATTETATKTETAPQTTDPFAPIITKADDGSTLTFLPAIPDQGTSGLTVHEDATTGVTTNVPHDGSVPTATNVAGAQVTPPPAAVEAAVAATVAAGVTIPAAS